MYDLMPCSFCGGKVIRRPGICGIQFFECSFCGAVVSFKNDEGNSNRDASVKYRNRRCKDSLSGGD